MSYFSTLELNLNDDVMRELRPGQAGAIRAMQAYAIARSDTAALISLPTGYGKSELIALAPAIFRADRTLVVAPSRIVRDMLAHRIREQEHLRRTGIVDPEAPRPKVLRRHRVIATAAAWDGLRDADLIVAHPQAISPALSSVVDPPDPKLIDLIIFDEAHHLASQTWSALLDAFPYADAIGFSATPFRRDRRRLPGRVVFEYPLYRAVQDGLFAPIQYREVAAGPDAAERDRAVAQAAIDEHRRRETTRSGVARLLVRADSVERATDLARLYKELDSGITLEVITHQTTDKSVREAVTRLNNGESDGVSFVGVLGEGFDLPTLKIAAYHNPHRSLPVTIQFAGRIARAGDEKESAIMIAAAAAHPEIVAELHRDNQRWDKLIDGLAREFARQPTPLWSASDADTHSLVEVFTDDNFRAFGLCQVAELDTVPGSEEIARAFETDRAFKASSTNANDSARVLAVIERRDLNTFGVLFERRHDLPWLRSTPDSYTETNYLALAVIPRDVTGAWLCVRSTLPDGLTAAVLDGVIGERRAPRGTSLARFATAEFASGNYTSLGQRSVHPATAGVKTYQTGAGRQVDRSVTPDDRFLTAVGHAIAVQSAGADSSQVGIAFDKQKVWRQGYLSLEAYHGLATEVAHALDRGHTPAALAQLRIPGTALSATAAPIAAELDVALDPTYSAELRVDERSCPIRHLQVAASRKRGGSIKLLLKGTVGASFKATVVIDPDGRVTSAEGTIIDQGRDVAFEDALRDKPPAIYFDDGSFLRGPGGHVAPNSDQDLFFAVGASTLELDSAPYMKLGASNQVLTIDDTISALPEKGGTRPDDILANAADLSSSPTVSLLQYASRQVDLEGADFIFCDDARGEKADIIAGWHSYGLTGTPHLRLIHCKAKKATDQPGARLPDLEEVVQQTLRSLDFVLAPASALVDQLEHRATNRPRRYVKGDAVTFRNILNADPISRTNEIWIMHPGMSAAALRAASPARKLLGGIRARLATSAVSLTLVGSE
ncbi:DEAD/DEAH box helicase family protein [Nocardioides renjunii]|uniref:DEAD/DEAH box helicase family protein n=1 Tax=Nocardioides renjunii TaxID=3095075 RepID=UPI002AFE28AA|nr:DEAD/DEAH box helicase family protein [Nocardioides sp. S-34]WQQ23882.1 DEAD/DEAH box helicase family protein [Nocardioides sp. S-34]